MKPRLLLVADDDPDTVEAYGVLFRSRGHAVEAAADGPGAIFKALELRPDAVVLDLGLPLMDGLEVLRRLRAPGMPRIPVLVLTGHASVDAAARARHDGADDVMIKPCEPLELCARVELLLQMDRSAEQASGEEEPRSGRIRLPRPRYRSRRVLEPVIESPVLLDDEIYRTAAAMCRRASTLRRQATFLTARSRDIQNRVAVPWRWWTAGGVPVSD